MGAIVVLLLVATVRQQSTSLRGLARDVVTAGDERVVRDAYAAGLPSACPPVSTRRWRSPQPAARGALTLVLHHEMNQRVKRARGISMVQWVSGRAHRFTSIYAVRTNFHGVVSRCEHPSSSWCSRCTGCSMVPCEQETFGFAFLRRDA